MVFILPHKRPAVLTLHGAGRGSNDILRVGAGRVGAALMFFGAGLPVFPAGRGDHPWYKLVSTVDVLLMMIDRGKSEDIISLRLRGLCKDSQFDRSQMFTCVHVFYY